MRCLYDGEHPCGSCPACLANRQRGFMFRLDQEKEKASFYFWLTLTYDEDHVPRLESQEMCFSKAHCREFFERLRSRYKSKAITFKHFLVSEYGPNATERPHYHLLLLAYGGSSDLAGRYKERQEIRKFLIEKAWPYGFVNEKTFHGRVLSYLTKYCLKPELIGQRHTMKPFTLISKGIGLSYLDSLPQLQKDQMLSSLDFSVRYGSGKISLPRYYVDRLAPHSAEDLRRLIPEDPLNGSWEDYERMSQLRARFFAKNNHLAFERAREAIKHQSPEAIQAEIRKKKREVGSAMADFRSKVKQRKDI